MTALLRRFLSTLRRTREDAELQAELETHLSLMVEERMARGMSREAAERDAALRFGGVVQLREAHAEWRGLAWLETWMSDARYALRNLTRNPRFALSAVFTTALSVGAATAVFSVVDRTLFRPLPYAHGDRLVSVGIHAPVIAPRDWMFAGHYRDWKSNLQQPFEAAGAWKGVTACDRNDGAPERLGCLLADRDLLDVLGVTMALGRNFSADEDEAGAPPVGILFHSYWNNRFGGDSGVLGRTLTVDGQLTRVVGVLPRDFRTPTLEQADILLPLRLRRQGQNQRVIHSIARLVPGATPQSAYHALQPLFQSFTGAAPQDFRSAVPMQLRTPGLQDQQTAAWRTGLLVLLGAVLAFVLMSCANVASLLLARAESRRHEFAVRASLGASPGRLISQTITESVLIGLFAGAWGCVLAWAFLFAFRLIGPGFSSRFGEPALDWRVLIFALGLSLTSSLAFGFAPAWERKQGENLAAPRVAARPRTRRLRSILTSAQFAVSVVLLSLMATFTASFWKLWRADMGYRPENVVSASFILPERGNPAAGDDAELRQISAMRVVEQRLREVPGVEAVALTDSVPPGGAPRSFPWVAVLGGGDASAKGKEGLVKWRFVTEDYLKVLGVQLSHGRPFVEADRSAGPQAVIINEAFATRRFGRTDVVGRTIYCDDCLIVGVMRDMRNSGPRAPATPEMLVLRRNTPNAFWRNQRPPVGWRAVTAIARSKQDATSLMNELRRAVQEVEPGIPVLTDTLRHQLEEYFEQPRSQAMLLALFALTGLGLAAVGLYGLTAYLAAARTREIGIRLALGASRSKVVAMLMRGGLASTAGGIVAGAIMTTGIMLATRSAIVDLQVPDARFLILTLVPLVVAALAGVMIPGIRAASIDPARALRQE